MRTYEIVWQGRDPRDDIFPDGLDSDPSLLFHGTSSTREVAIDAEGLRPNAAGVPASSVRAILACFDALHWYGTTIAGAPTLHSFTVRNDFRDDDISPLYLSEHSSQAVHFASPRWAGGEKVSSFLRAYEDLERMHSDPEFRAAALGASDQWNGNFAPPELSPNALEQIRECITGCAEIAHRAQREQAEYRHAVVYAIRPPTSVRATWEDCKGMGIRVLAPIPLEWIIAKLRILPPVAK